MNIGNIDVTDKKIIKEYNGGKVTITFGKRNPEIKEKVLWLLTECYCDRVKGGAEQNVTNNSLKEKAS